MSDDTFTGIVHKFSLLRALPDGRDLDCYLAIGEDESGTPRVLDLYLGKSGDELTAHRVLMELASDLLALDGGIAVVANRLAYQNFLPGGQVKSDGGIHSCDSICDYIGKFLKNRYGV